MSDWFITVRQDFIAATLRQFGQVKRNDLTRQFGISMQQASADIARFLATEPPRVEYDPRLKRYFLREEAEVPHA